MTEANINYKHRDGITLPNSIFITSHSPSQTHQLGLIIGTLSQPGDIVLLSGPLGVGKTCLAQGIAKALGIREDTASPSYVLMREFSGRIPLYHMDLYRLEFNEISELGLDDYLYGHGLCVIEWAEKGQFIMPEQHLQLTLAYDTDTIRLITITHCGKRYTDMVEHISQINNLPDKKDLA